MKYMLLLVSAIVVFSLAGNAASQGMIEITSDQLSAHQRLQYNSLLLILDDFEAEQDEKRKKELARELLDQSRSLAEQVPDLVDIWELRAEAGLYLNSWSPGWHAGQQMMRLGALNSTDRKTTLLMAKLNRRGWLGDDPEQIQLRELRRVPKLKDDSELPEAVRKELSDTINKLSMGQSWDGYNQLKALRLKIGEEAFLQYPLARRAMAEGLPMAASRGDTELAKAAIAAGADPNASMSGRSALFWAAYNGEEDISRLLLTAGAKADSHDKLGRSVLVEPAWKGSLGIVTLLLNAGSKPDVKGKSKNLLHEVVARGHHEVVKAMIAAGVNLYTMSDDDDPMPVLLSPVRTGDKKMVRILVLGGANPKAQYHGKDMYYHAKKMKQKEVYSAIKAAVKERKSMRRSLMID